VGFAEADGEKLHDFARVVFVGFVAGDGIRLAVAHHAEVGAHHGAEGDILEEVAVVSEGIPEQHVVVECNAFVRTIELTKLRDDKDLGEGEGHALAELIRCGECALPPDFVARALPAAALVTACDPFVGAGYDGVAVVAGWHGELGIDPWGVGISGQSSELCFGGAEGDLGEEARGLSDGVGMGGRGWSCFHRRHGLPTGCGEELTDDFRSADGGGVDANPKLSSGEGLEDLLAAETARRSEVP